MQENVWNKCWKIVEIDAGIMVEINAGKMVEINAGEWLYHKGEEEAGHPHTSSPLSHPPQCGPNTVTLNPHTSSQSTIQTTETSPSGFSSKKTLHFLRMVHGQICSILKNISSQTSEDISH